METRSGRAYTRTAVIVDQPAAVLSNPDRGLRGPLRRQYPKTAETRRPNAPKCARAVPGAKPGLLLPIAEKNGIVVKLPRHQMIRVEQTIRNRNSARARGTT